MKKLLLSTFCLLLFLTLFMMKSVAQEVVKIPTPDSTVITYSSTDSRAFALTGLQINYTNIQWPGGASDSGCIYWGINDTLFQVINGNSLMPPDDTKPLDSLALTTMSNLTIYGSNTNLASGQLCYYGYTNINDVMTYGVRSYLVLQYVYARKKSNGAIIPFEYVNGKFLAKVNSEDFYIYTQLLIQWPGASYTATDGSTLCAGCTYFALDLYNKIHTNLNSSILTSWNGGDFYRIPFNATFGLTDPACFGANTGTISTTVTGGFGAPYSYTWNTASPTSEDQVDLKAGNYSVNISDNGAHCLITRDVTLNQPDSLKANLLKTDVLCFGETNGTITATPTGGVEPVTLEWYDSSSANTVSNLPAGKYGIKLTDYNNCVTNDTAIIAEPALLEYSLALKSPVCIYGTDGELSVTVSGGIEPYTYLWSTGETNDTLAQASVGEYSVTIQDQNLCTQVAHTLLPSLSNISIPATVSDVACFGENNGNILIEPAGGLSPYTILWSNGDVSALADSLAPGEYIVNVNDEYGCALGDTFLVKEPSMLEANATASDVNCFQGTDGSVDLTVTGGTEPYTYLWINDSTSQDITDLNADTYSVIVEDANHCAAVASATVADGKSPFTSYNFSVDAGTVTFTNMSDAGTYDWNFGDGNVSQETNPVHIYTSNGTFSVCLSLTTTCSSVPSCQDVVIQGLSVTGNTVKSIQIYPNPANDHFKLSWNSSEKPSAMIMYNALGSEVLNHLVTGESVSINVSTMHAGVYYVKLVFPGHSELAPLIIKR